MPKHDDLCSHYSARNPRDDRLRAIPAATTIRRSQIFYLHLLTDRCALLRRLAPFNQRIQLLNLAELFGSFVFGDFRQIATLQHAAAANKPQTSQQDFTLPST